jgi:hypothetical protein
MEPSGVSVAHVIGTPSTAWPPARRATARVDHVASAHLRLSNAQLDARDRVHHGEHSTPAALDFRGHLHGPACHHVAEGFTVRPLVELRQVAVSPVRSLESASTP